MPIGKKMSLSDIIIDNSGSFDQLEEQFKTKVIP